MSDLTVTNNPTNDSKEKTEESNNPTNDSKEKAEESNTKEFVDRSEEKANDLKKFSTDPIEVPGTELLELEPKAALAASNVVGILVNKLGDPNFTKRIAENMETSLELILETKKNKLQHLEEDSVKKSQSGGNVFFTEEECSFF